MYQIKVLYILYSHKSPKHNHSLFEDEETRGSDLSSDLSNHSPRKGNRATLQTGKPMTYSQRFFLTYHFLLSKI